MLRDASSVEDHYRRREESLLCSLAVITPSITNPQAWALHWPDLVSAQPGSFSFSLSGLSINGYKGEA